ncbi:Tol-Pal system protein TolB [Nitratiruptor tergarcus]|uniref:TolB protein n=1 Tax=Nitratiruptor tergarcus DSM 16512 TaxID=1069081 RepID=A0A1W1WW19_9BACT|nr:Tol-Pal system protein TolB [Nitratiruptor tergarcus]SMC09933.1 TolB protein [Nitratiruptor tergarcus DSM 16512]
MKRVLIVFVLAVTLFAADMTLEIVKDVGSKPKIAIEDATLDVDGNIDRKFFRLLIGDLEVTAHFNVDQKRNLASMDSSIDYVKYKSKDYLLRYRLFFDDFGKLNVEAKIFSIKDGNTIIAKLYRISDKDRFPFLAHKIIYDLNNALHFPDVSFLKSFVVFAKYTKPKHADIVISDYTLTYQKVVVHGGLNLFPKWADKEQRRFYYTKIGDKPTLYLVDIYKGTQQKILQSEGMLVCSDVSEDGRKLLLTMAPQMQPDIYEYNTWTKTLNRITTYPGIDVNGNYVENEQRVVFVSDRLGYPTIFAKNIGSRAVERVVYHGRNNSACSTFGDYVVYSSRETDNAFGSNTFNLYLTSTTSDYIRKLTANGVNIFPRFSTDGETILFIKEYGRQSGLGLIRLKYNKSYIYPLRVGKIQSIDW